MGHPSRAPRRTGIVLTAAALAMVGATGPAAGAFAMAGDVTVWVGSGSAVATYRYVAAGAQTSVPFGVTTAPGPVTVRIDASSLGTGVTVTSVSGPGCVWSASGGGACTFVPGGVRSAKVNVRATAKAPAGLAGRLRFRLAGDATVTASAGIDVRVGTTTDLAVTAADVTGQVGGVVAVPLTVRNLGPNTSPRWELRLSRVPHGTVFTGGTGCARDTAGAVVCMAAPHLLAGSFQTVRPTFRIDRAGTDPAGGFTLHPALPDPNRANELLRFAVRVAGVPPAGPAPDPGLPPGTARDRLVAPAGPTPVPTPAGTHTPPPTGEPLDPGAGAPVAVGQERSEVGPAAGLGGRTPVSGTMLALAAAGLFLGLGGLALAGRRRRQPVHPIATHRASPRREPVAAGFTAGSATTELPIVGTGWTRSSALAASGAYYADADASPPEAPSDATERDPD